jgi:hypothetical protein
LKYADVAPDAPFGGIKGSGLGVEFGQPSSGEDGPKRV